MISSDYQIIGRLSGNQVLVAKREDPDSPDSDKQRVIEDLKKRDRDVREHESAHASDPRLVKIGSAQYDYTIGPDGKAYATGGRVTLSTGTSRTPEEAIDKAEALKRASMAPGEPSSKDFQAMNAASAMEFEAMNRIYSDRGKRADSTMAILKGMNFSTYA